MKLCPTCHLCYEDSDETCAHDGATLIFSRYGSRLVGEKYRLDRLLGRGGMGAVYASTHVELNRPLALKLLLPDSISDPQALERFRREAITAARLNHPNVADTYDYGPLPDGGAYIVMELVSGETLRQRLKRAKPLPLIEAVRIGRQVADGIEAAHSSGIVHRDLKPSNIILTQDHRDELQAKVVDFGIAKLKEHTTSDAALTATGSLIGTPRYMSPEQCAGHEMDTRSDIYSLGVILYEMLAGRPPFDAPTATAIALKHIQEPPVAVNLLRPGLPETLVAVVMRSLAKAPADRPQTAAELARELRAIEQAGDFSVTAEQTPADSGDAFDVEQADRLSAIEPTAHPSSVAQTDQQAGAGTERGEADYATNRAGAPTLEDSAPNFPAGNGQRNRIVTPTDKTIPDAPAEQAEHAPRPARDGEMVTQVAPPHDESLPSDSAPHPLPPTPPALPLPATDAPSIVTRLSEPRPGRSRALLIRALAALLLISGIAALWLTLRAVSTGPAEEERAQVAASPSPTERGGAQTALAPTPAPSPTPSPASTSSSAAPDGELLRSALSEWVAATNARDLARQMRFYAPRLTRFYLAGNVSRTSVRAEKAALFAEASAVQMSVSDVQVSISPNGRSAVMRFRKAYNISRNGGTESGEVLQELRWVKTAEGWRINSERDLQQLR